MVIVVILINVVKTIRYKMRCEENNSLLLIQGEVTPIYRGNTSRVIEKQLLPRKFHIK